MAPQQWAWCSGGFLLSYHSSGKRGTLVKYIILTAVWKSACETFCSLYTGRPDFVLFVFVGGKICKLFMIRYEVSVCPNINVWIVVCCFYSPNMWDLFHKLLSFKLFCWKTQSVHVWNCFAKIRSFPPRSLSIWERHNSHTRRQAHEHTDKTKHEITAKFGPLNWCCKQRGGACALSF